jgi:hypothetical protein
MNDSARLPYSVSGTRHQALSNVDATAIFRVYLPYMIPLLFTRTYLGAPDGLEDYNLSNLGIYGLGKRRTIKQLEDFMKIQMATKTSFRPQGVRDARVLTRVSFRFVDSCFLLLLQTSCIGDEWVPYDVNISPTDNLYDEPDNLNPQPEYPLRTELTFYEEEDGDASSIEVLEGDLMGDSSSASKDASLSSDETVISSHKKALPSRPHGSPFPPASVLIPLWLLGLVVWFMTFANTPLAKRHQARKKKVGPKDV